MFYSSQLKTTPRGGESPPSRDGKAPPVPVCEGASGVDQPLADQLIQICVYSAAHGTHVLQLKCSETVADLSAAVEQLGYDLSVCRLYHLGGPPIPRDDRHTLAEAGLQPNISLQVLRRLRGGVEVTLFGQQHSLGDAGLLDLTGKNVGPAKLKEVTAFFSSPESAAVRRLVLSGSMITDRGKDLSGIKALCEVLPTLKHLTSLDLVNCGLGVAVVAKLAAAIHAGAVINSLALGSNPIGDEAMIRLLDALKDVRLSSFDISRTNCRVSTMSKLAELLRPCIATYKTKIKTACRSGIEVNSAPSGSLDAGTVIRILESQINSQGTTRLRTWRGWISLKPNIVELVNDMETTTPFSAVLNLLTVDSTGCIYDPQTYTLTGGEDKIELSNKMLGPADIQLLAAWLATPAGAAIKEVNISMNPISVDGAKALGTILLDSSLKCLIIGSKSTRVPVNDAEVTELNFEGQDFTPVEVTLVAAATSTMAVLTSMNCLNNPLGEGVHTIIKIFEETPRIRTLCGLEEGVEQIDWSDSGKGPADVALLAAEVKAGRACAALNSVTVDSTGDLGTHWELRQDEQDKRVSNQIAYTLSVGEENIDLSSKNLGPADVTMVAAWLQRPEVSATIASLVLDFNDIFGTRYRYLKEAVSDKFAGDCDSFLAALKNSHITTLSLQVTGIGPVALRKLATSLPVVVTRLMLNRNMVTSSERKRYGYVGSGDREYDKDISGLTSLCDALPALKNPIDLDLSDCGLSVNGVNPVIHAIQAGDVGAIGLARCKLEPPMVAQVLSVASEVSRSRLRVAQVLAFCCALHDRMGADSAICDMVDKGVVDIWQIVASIVHARHGHEGLCSTLACQNPWFAVCVRGLHS